MNYDETIAYLYGLGHETLAMKLGLENIRRLMCSLEYPQQEFPAVHIAGTNGKGSTAAMTAAIAVEAGLCTGLYTSPHLIEITERIRINGEQITKTDFARLGAKVRAASEHLVATGELPGVPTFFEQVTAIGFLYFAERKVDLAVLEVGLGGRLDATNICCPIVTAITPIGEDHQQYLGTTIASIAAEKAGIIKPVIPVISAPQLPEAMDVIQQRCAELNAPLIIADDEFELSSEADGFYRLAVQTKSAVYETHLNLRGRHQAINGLTAIHIAEEVNRKGINIPHSAIIAGLSRTIWPGRIDMVKTERGQRIILDGAHNLDGARSLRAFLDEHYASTRIIFIFGAMSDKAIDQMAEMLFPIATKVIAVRIDNPRAADPLRIAGLAARAGRPTIVAADISEAIKMAERATTSGDMICICGSLYLIGESRELLGI